MVREHREGAISLLVGAVHVLDEVAPEVPVLKPDRVTGLLQYPSNPGRPGSVSLVEADEEVTLVTRVVGQLGSVRRHASLNFGLGHRVFRRVSARRRSISARAMARFC